MRRFVNSCWSTFKWAFALLVLAALLGGGYLYFRLDEEIRRYAQNTLATHYQHLEVRVGGARFVPGRGVTVFDVSLAERPTNHSPQNARPLLHVDELSLAGRFELRQFVEGQPVVDRVIVRRPRLVARRSPLGQWSFEQLLPPPKGGERAPPLEITDATLVIIDEASPNAVPFVVQGVDALLEKAVDARGTQTSTIRFEGSAKESLAKQVEFSGEVDLRTGGFNLTAGADKLRLNHELLASLPMIEKQTLAGLELQAVGSCRINARRQARDTPLEWGASFQVMQGAVSHPRLPRRLTDLKLSGSCDAQGLAIRSLTGKCGVAEITAACNRHGWAAKAPIAARGRITDLPLDKPLLGALPASLQKQWRRFRPAGVVDAAGSLTFDGVRWRVNGTADCRGVSAEDAEKFPYRMTDARGTLRFSDAGEAGNGLLDINLQGLAEGRVVAVTAAFRGLPCPGQHKPATPRIGPAPPCPVGWVQIDAPRLRVSPAMLAALEPHPEAAKIVRSVSPSGDFGFRWRMERQSEEDLSPSVVIDIDALDCAITYDQFPYPLEHLRGRITARDGVWSFEGVESREANGPRVVTASGSLKRVDGRQQFGMRLTAVAAPLDDALRTALPAEHQSVWAQLRPEGRVNLTTDVSFTQGDARPTIVIVASPYQRSVSLSPTFFHYRLNRLDGKFVMQDGRLTFTAAQAEHGRTQLSGNGSWTPGGNGGWQFRLEDLNVDYLDADHDLRLAAPLALRRVIDELQPDGSFGVHNSRVAFTYDPRRPDDLRADWDIQLDCHQTDVNLGVRVEDVSGGIRLVGINNGDDCRSYGELNLDTLFWNDLQLTNIRGPLWANASECRLGQGVVDKQPGAPPVKITADAYGGKVLINTRVLQGERPQYGMAVDLKDIDLERFSRDYLQLPTPITGRADGTLTLQGKGTSIYGLEGAGNIQVHDANLWELP
ncbi:MAG: hypothetical protein AAGF31_11440, partial [Planctomycetota bacterium]